MVYVPDVISHLVSSQQQTSGGDVPLEKKHGKQMSFWFWINQCYFMFCVMLPEIFLSYKEIFKPEIWRSIFCFSCLMVCCKSVAFLSLLVSHPPSLPSIPPHFAFSLFCLFFLPFCLFFILNKCLLRFCYIADVILCVRDLTEKKTKSLTAGCLYSVRSEVED